jgi:hypothetical protein
MLRGADGELRGIVHRDVSPQNVLVSLRGDVKVIDFGIAHAKDRIGGDTREGLVKGKINYMAPEQALREPIGPFTDVFSAGATLYRMLAGRPPHDGGNDVATLHMLLKGAPTPPLPDNVPPLVAAIVERAISHDPADRYPSALAMQTALEAALEEEKLLADVAVWVKRNGSEAAQDRRAQLATRSIDTAPPRVPVSFVAELGPIPARAPALAALAAPNTLPSAFDGALELERGRSAPQGPPPQAPPLPRAAPAPRAAPPPTPGAPLAPPPNAPPPNAPPAFRADLAPHAAPPAPNSDPEPGMLDVRALVARVKAPGGRGAAPPQHARGPAPAAIATPGPGEGMMGAPHASENELPPLSDGAPVQAREVPYVGPATQALPDAGARASGWIKLAGLGTGLVLALVVLLLMLPRIVKDRVVASAREAGIELTIDRVGVGFGGVSLRGVTAKSPRVPSAELQAEELFATGFSAREVRVRGLEVKLDGSASDVSAALLRFYEESRPRFAGTPSDARKINVSGAHVAWTGLFGPESKLEVTELGLDLDSRGVGTEDVRASVSHFEVKTRRTLFGPWAGSFERNATTSRLRLLLDPPVPDGPSALIVWGKGSSPHLTVKIPRSPLARLGVRPEELGLPADPGTELEAKLEGGQGPTSRNELSGRVDLFGLRLKSLKAPIDLKLTGNATGLPGKPLDFDKTSVTLGPFTAGVTGSITPTDLGFRLDATWRTAPVACEKLARAEARTLGPIAAALQDLAHTTGAARVTGTAQGAGIIAYDTKAPDEGTVTFVSKEACGLSIFGM